MASTVSYTAETNSITIRFESTLVDKAGFRVDYTVNGTRTSSELFGVSDMPVETVISGLSSNTTYRVTWELLSTTEGNLEYESGTLSATTAVDNTPKTATVSQWQDLAGRVNGKAEKAWGDYSTTEKDTGATWIDGSTIYKKTINFGALPNSTSKIVAHGISGLATIIRVEAVAIDSGGTALSLPYAENNSTGNIPAWVDSAGVGIRTGQDRSGYSGYFTLYYTKSS